LTADQIQDFRFSSLEEWRAFFSPYSHIVLVGNSEAAQPEQLRQTYPSTTLFVFFNKVYKVLDESFDSPCLLIARSGSMGANIVHRREVADVVKFFPTDRFLGIVNVRVDASEALSPVSAFNGATIRHLDLRDVLGQTYPSGKFATSGFALTLWLLVLGLPGQVVLAGFSAKRSDKWKVFDVHDWNFEQIYLAVRARRGDIAMLRQFEATPIATLIKVMPGVDPIEILTEANEVLSRRLDDANQQIDRLMSLTKLQRRIYDFFARLKPKTRKQRYLAMQRDKQSGG
jgi:hypothetical protein